jgi:hypothetical protein
MQNITLQLQAGAALPAQVKGKVLQIIGTGGSDSLTVQFTQGSQVAYTVNGIQSGWRLAPTGGFDALTFTSANNATLTAIVTNGDIDIQVLENTSTIANAASNPVPVSIVGEPGAPFSVTIAPGSTVEVTADNVGINNTEANPVPVSLVVAPDASVAVTLAGSTDDAVIPVQAQPVATTITEPAAVLVASVGAALLAASATRKGFRVRNAGTGLLALTASAAQSLANAVIVLNPGDVWTESEAPGAAWFAVSDVGTTANVQVLA